MKKIRNTEGKKTVEYPDTSFLIMEVNPQKVEYYDKKKKAIPLNYERRNVNFIHKELTSTHWGHSKAIGYWVNLLHWDFRKITFFIPDFHNCHVGCHKGYQETDHSMVLISVIFQIFFNENSKTQVMTTILQLYDWEENFGNIYLFFCSQELIYNINSLVADRKSVKHKPPVSRATEGIWQRPKLLKGINLFGMFNDKKHRKTRRKKIRGDEVRTKREEELIGRRGDLLSSEGPWDPWVIFCGSVFIGGIKYTKSTIRNQSIIKKYISSLMGTNSLLLKTPGEHFWHLHDKCHCRGVPIGKVGSVLNIGCINNWFVLLTYVYNLFLSDFKMADTFLRSINN
ncbi:hypothetical protein VP01_1150g1 [Puccinia sorghi]|uniref:Uncharacterized protein n=1 Tax=Puccinia sorghi TaxID=27349 RepID=A0A0L6VRR0_9BASI|nr:hypothetical protein VP01_1150g1 [Puccinia sorghi]